MTRRRGRVPQLPLPKRPYRDSVLFYLILSVALVLVAWATGGSLARALAVAAGFFVVATAWSWWRFRVRLGRERPGRASAARRESP